MAAAQDTRWAEWVAHNLAFEVPEESLLTELVQNGYDDVAARALLDDTKSSAGFRAATRIARDVRKWTSLSEVLLDLEAEAYDLTKIPRVSGLSETEFLKTYYAGNRPVIIEDVVPDWPACAKWSLKFFKERYGGETVRFQRRNGGDHRDAFVDHTRTARLSDYLALLESEEERANYYLIAHDRLLDQPAFRPLFEDIVFDQRYFDAGRALGRVFLWIGPPGASTPLHRDLGNVFFAQIVGQKRVKMIPSKQLHLVYNDVGYHSDVDLEEFSVEQFPMLGRATIMDEIIAPGELLFIPVGWWHWVKSLEITVTVTGNNFKFRNSFTEIF